MTCVLYPFVDSDIVKTLQAPSSTRTFPVWVFKFFVFIYVAALFYFSALIISFVCFNYRQEQDSGSGVLIVNANKVASEPGWGVRDG